MIAVRTALAFLRRDLLTQRGRGASLFFQAANVLLTVVAYAFLSRFIEERAAHGGTASALAGGGVGYFPFVLIGMAANGALVEALNGLPRSFAAQEASGVLSWVLLGGTRPAAVALHASLWPVLRAATLLIAYLGVGLAAGAWSPARANGASALLVAALAIMAFGALGIAAAATAVLLGMGNPLLWALSTTSWLLGGVLYPTEVLPAPLRVIARAVPLTHALEGLRAALLEGAGVREVLPSCIALAAVAAVALPIGLLLVAVGVRRVRTRGSFARG